MEKTKGSITDVPQQNDSMGISGKQPDEIRHVKKEFVSLKKNKKRNTNKNLVIGARGIVKGKRKVGTAGKTKLIIECIIEEKWLTISILGLNIWEISNAMSSLEKIDRKTDLRDMNNLDQLGPKALRA